MKRIAELTTSVRAQEYRKAIAYAAMKMAMDWKRMARRSDMLSWRVLERPVMVFVTLPTEISSSLLTGCANRARMYSSRIAEEAFRLIIRKEIWTCYSMLYNVDGVHTVKI